MRIPGVCLSALLLLCSVSAWPAAGRLVVCDDVLDPLTLDPHKQFSEKNHILLQQIYEGLVRFDPEGRIEPALAVSWERIDPLTMRFHLRQGVRFHDGEAFGAQAVRFSIARYLDPTTGFPALGFISSLDKAVVVDSATVDIVTKFPDGLLLNRLAGFVLIVPPDYIQKNGAQILENRPNGTGPFRFVAWHKGSDVTLEANHAYWMPGYPKVKELVFRFLPWQDQIAALLSGGVDILTELPGTMTTTVSKSKSAEVVKRETYYAMVGPFNFTEGPLRDLRVRQALNFAVNREDLIRYDVLGNGRPTAALSLPGEEGHDPDLQPYAYDPARARKLLAEAGYSGGLSLDVLVKEQGIRAAKILKKQLEAVGVTLNLTITPDSEIIKDVGRRHWDMLYGGCPDPMSHMYFISSVVLYSRSPYSIVHDPDFDKRLEDVAATLDPALREAKAKSLDRLIHDQAMSLFTYQRVKTYGVSRRVNFVPSVTGMPYFFRTQINDKNRKVVAKRPV